MFPAVLSSEYWSLCCLLSLALEQCSLHSPGTPCSGTVLPVVLSCPWSRKRVTSCSELTPALEQWSPLFSGWKVCFRLSPSSESTFLILLRANVSWPMNFPKISTVGRRRLAHEWWGIVSVGWPINYGIDGWSLADFPSWQKVYTPKYWTDFRWSLVFDLSVSTLVQCLFDQCLFDLTNSILFNAWRDDISVKDAASFFLGSVSTLRTHIAR